MYLSQSGVIFSLCLKKSIKTFHRNIFPFCPGESNPSFWGHTRTEIHFLQHYFFFFYNLSLTGVRCREKIQVHFLNPLNNHRMCTAGLSKLRKNGLIDNRRNIAALNQTVRWMENNTRTMPSKLSLTMCCKNKNGCLKTPGIAKVCGI